MISKCKYYICSKLCLWKRKEKWKKSAFHVTIFKKFCTYVNFLTSFFKFEVQEHKPWCRCDFFFDIFFVTSAFSVLWTYLRFTYDKNKIYKSVKTLIFEKELWNYQCAENGSKYKKLIRFQHIRPQLQLGGIHII